MSEVNAAWSLLFQPQEINTQMAESMALVLKFQGGPFLKALKRVGLPGSQVLTRATLHCVRLQIKHPSNPVTFCDTQPTMETRCLILFFHNM